MGSSDEPREACSASPGPRENAQPTAPAPPIAGRRAGFSLLVWGAWLAATLILWGWLAWGGTGWVSSSPQAGWSYDDRQALLDNPLVTGERPARQAWTEDYWHHRQPAGLYRPLVTLSFRWQRAGSQDGPGSLDPGWLHAGNVLLHLWVVGLAAWIWGQGQGADRKGRRSLAYVPVIALGLLAWHPVQVEGVAWISGRSVSLAAALGLSAWALWKKGPRWLRPLAAWLGSGLPMLAKEEGLAFAAAFWVLAGGLDERRSRWRARACVLGGASSVLLLRWFALGPPWELLKETPWSDWPLDARLWEGLKALGLAGMALVLPTRVPLAGSPGQLPSEPAWVLVMLLVVGLVFASRTRLGNRPNLTGEARSSQAERKAGLVGLIAALLPWLQWLPIPELFGLRMLYLPLLFFVPVACAWARRRPSKHDGARDGARSIGPLAAALCLYVFCAWGVSALAPAYGSSLAYWSHRAEREEHSALVWNGLGNEQLAAEDLVGAQRSFEQATDRNPNYSRAWVGLALVAEAQGRFEPAREHLQQALRANPNNPVAHANMGRLLRKHHPQQALHHWMRATEIQPGRMVFWRGRAGAHERLQQWEAAASAIESALQRSPKDPDLLRRAQRLRERLQAP